MSFVLMILRTRLSTSWVKVGNAMSKFRSGRRTSPDTFKIVCTGTVVLDNSLSLAKLVAIGSPWKETRLPSLIEKSRVMISCKLKL